MHDDEPLPPVTPAEFDALAASPAVAEARFACARHGTEAGTVRLRGGYAQGWMVDLDSFVCRQHQRIHERSAEALRDALARGDVWEIYVMDVEWAPFFCHHCARVYCGHCWQTWEVLDDDFPHWVDQVRGTCPEGHERMLSD